MAIKLCIDCKWISGFSPSSGAPSPLCNHLNAPHSLVNGKPIKTCSRMRDKNWWTDDECGIDGDWFEVKVMEEPKENGIVVDVSKI